jgi:hypothetical protein
MRRRGLLAAQLGISATVLGLLWSDAGIERMRAVFAGVDARWVAAAAAVQAAGLLLRATRVWAAMDGAAPLGVVVRGALTANLGHLVVPSRVADLAGAVWIARRAGLPVERGIAGYATAGFLEAVAFGSGLIGLFAGAAPVIEQVLTGAQRREALGWVTIATLGGVVAMSVLLKLVGRAPEVTAVPTDTAADVAVAIGASGSWGGGAAPATPPEPTDAPGSPTAGTPTPPRTLRSRIDAAIAQARGVLGNPGRLALNLALGAAQIAVVLGVFRCILAALALDVPAPWLAGALVMSVGAVGGMVLPPHYGANTSASATLVLVPFGATAPEALAFGGILWFTAVAPDVLLGLVGLWSSRDGGPAGT